MADSQLGDGSGAPQPPPAPRPGSPLRPPRPRPQGRESPRKLTSQQPAQVSGAASGWLRRDCRGRQPYPGPPRGPRLPTAALTDAHGDGLAANPDQLSKFSTFTTSPDLASALFYQTPRAHRRRRLSLGPSSSRTVRASPALLCPSQLPPCSLSWRSP